MKYRLSLLALIFSFHAASAQVGSGGISGNPFPLNVPDVTTAGIGGALLAVGGCSSTNVTVLGAVPGMGVVVTPVAAPPSGVYWYGYISAADTVVVRQCSSIAATPAATQYAVKVLR